MAKEGKRSFDLDKSSNHKFEIKKNSKRKFDLSKDSDEGPIIVAPKAQINIPSAPKPISTPKPTPTPATDGRTAKIGGDDNKKTKKWVIIGVIAILVLLAWWLFSEIGGETDVTAETTEVVAPVDSATNEANDDGQIEEPTGQPEVAKVASDSKSSEDQSANDQNNEEQPPVAKNEVDSKQDQTKNSKEESTTGKDASEEGSKVPTPTKEKPKATKKPSSTSQEDNVPMSDTERMAKLVIKGKYGVGRERKQRLGSRYDAIQSCVNEMYKQGLVR